MIFFVSQPTFITELQSSIEEALDYSQLFLLGDINIDFLNLRNVQLADCLYLFSLRNVINEPTRVSDTVSSFVDPVIVSDSCDILDPSC